MSLNGMVALTFEGGLNGDVFKYFVEQMLVLTLGRRLCRYGQLEFSWGRGV
jgi:hypothetical protein